MGNVIIVWNRTDETANTLTMLIFVPDNIFESLEEPLPTKIPIRYVGPPRPKTSRPPVSDMVLTAIRKQKKRNGSSLPAIKRYIADKYKVDVTTPPTPSQPALSFLLLCPSCSVTTVHLLCQPDCH